MLKNLFVSKVRIKILDQFFTNPEEGFHVRGLVRILDEEINAVRRELINLQEAGILTSEKQNNKLVYKLVPTCPVISELKSLIYKDHLLAKKIYEIREQVGTIEILILTQAFLKDKYESDLDVDLLFIGEIDLRKLSVAMKSIEKEINRDLRYSVVTIKDYEFAKKKREPFILNIIQKDYILLIGTEKALAV